MTNFLPKTPERLNAFFLANKAHNGLFMPPGGSSHALVMFDGKGRQVVGEVSVAGLRKTILPLSDIATRHFDIFQATRDAMLPFLVTPEMEVERIFNSLRFKYLRAILLSNFPNPGKCISSSFNKAFQALAGLNVYQGNPGQRKTNDAFWRDAGFTAEARDQDWEKEQVDLKTILALMKRINEPSRLYSELIAIKPGFHELWLHDDYFRRSSTPSGPSPRDTVFRLLRNQSDLSDLNITRLPPEINGRSYLSYAPCNVTEGPFVFRKRDDVSYFDEIRRIRTKRRIRTLKDKFHILDYYSHDLSTQDKLEKFLELAEPFCRYPAVAP